MRGSPLLLRDTDVVALIDTFVVSAITSLMAVRLYLFLAGYPRIGGGGLHIAHMIWGGLLMLAAMIISLSFVAPGARWATAFFGGVGFGLFIDEIGKFLTSDNNYFFRPAPVLVYTVFVALFLLSRAITRRGGFSSSEYLVNAIELLKQAASGGIDEQDRAKALAYLAAAPEGELRHRLETVFRDVPGAPEPSIAARLRARVLALYDRVCGERWFPRAVAALVITGSAGALIEVALILAVRDHPWRSGSFDISFSGAGSISLLGGLEIVAALVSLGLAVAAALAGSGRHAGLRLQEGAVFVWILIIQPFAFYEAQFFASAGMLLSLPMLALVQYVLRVESGRQQPGVSAQPARSFSRSAPARKPAP